MTTFHCKKCSYEARSIKAMGEHYRKKHPQAMKRKATKSRKSEKSAEAILRRVRDLVT